MRRIAAAAAAVSLIILTACSDGEDGNAAGTAQTPADPPAETTTAETPAQAPPTDTPSESDEQAGPVTPADAETIVTGLEAPWGIAFVGTDEALVTERDSGRILLVTADGDVTEVGVVDDLAPDGEGGLQGIVLLDDWVYVYYTTASDNRVVRMRFDGSSLGEQEVIIDGIPRAGFHNGGRMTFGPDGMLYIATGDATASRNSQNVDSLGGKILRLNPDGSVPDGNPFDSPVWSFGHRNPQGLAFDDDGRLWASEFGHPRAASLISETRSSWLRCAARHSGKCRSSTDRPASPRRSLRSNSAGSGMRSLRLTARCG
jgi:glucose/arabinose dehydrogenase